MTAENSQQDPQKPDAEPAAPDAEPAAKKKPERATAEEIARRVREAVTAADDRKAVELKVLELAKVTDFTDYFLICSGTSDRQVMAIADAVDARLRAEKVRPLHREGMNGGHWVLLDYGDFIVHVFDEETRRFYGLERLWGDAPEVTERFRAAS